MSLHLSTLQCCYIESSISLNLELPHAGRHEGKQHGTKGLVLQKKAMRNSHHKTAGVRGNCLTKRDKKTASSHP